MAARMQAATRLIAEIRACAFSRLIYGWLTEGFDNARSQRSKGAARHTKPPSACADLAFSGVVRGDARCDASGSPWRAAFPGPQRWPVASAELTRWEPIFTKASAYAARNHSLMEGWPSG